MGLSQKQLRYLFALTFLFLVIQVIVPLIRNREHYPAFIYPSFSNGGRYQIIYFELDCKETPDKLIVNQKLLRQVYNQEISEDLLERIIPCGRPFSVIKKVIEPKARFQGPQTLGSKEYE